MTTPEAIRLAVTVVAFFAFLTVISVAAIRAADIPLPGLPTAKHPGGTS